ncbi:type II secretion system protein N [Ferrimonas pelagia]|uniref:Type II secretion system protein N n=1 Tax=Ferrimonas pelagia TaxID=1177826 RepID=A0ABP9F0R0_9GAMM
MLKYGLAGFVVYLLFLLANVPAAWIWKLAPKPPGVAISGIDGTLWQGQIGQLNVADRQLENIHWILSPAQLLTATAALDFRIEDSVVQAQGAVQYGLGGLAAENLRFSAPLGWLVGDTRLPLRTELSGGVTLNVRQLEQGQPWCEQLNGRLLITGLDVRNQFGHYPLGDLAGSLACQQGNAQLSVDEAENRIGVQGEALLLADNQVKLAATIRETDEQPTDLRQALMFLGQPDSSGAYPLNYNGVIPGL